jgi:hypothetical protein
MLLAQNTNKNVDITNWQGDFAIWIEKKNKHLVITCKTKPKFCKLDKTKLLQKEKQTHTLLKTYRNKESYDNNS